jgi:CRP/FNR family transcriptional regulator, cyclic AMP receptor protein
MHGVSLDESAARRYGKSSIIVYQGEIPRDGFMVKKGVVRVYQIGAGGDSRTITFYTKGDIFPVAWLGGNSAPAMYYYEAFDDVDLIPISSEAWEEAMSQPESLKEFNSYMVQNYQASLIRIAALEQAKAHDKIAYSLFYLLLRHGREIMPGIFRLELKLKHQDIAELVGLTRETTAIEVHALQSSKVLSYQNQRYLIKREKLLGVLNEDSLRQLEL